MHSFVEETRCTREEPPLVEVADHRGKCLEKTVSRVKGQGGMWALYTGQVAISPHLHKADDMQQSAAPVLF